MVDTIFEPTSKAVILARGLGTRMRAKDNTTALSDEERRVASQGVKALMPIAGGKTLLEMSIENLNSAGFDNVCLVIGPEHDSIKEFCKLKRLNVEFAIQPSPQGTADAVLAAESFVSDELFLVVNSDNLYPIESLRRLRTTNRPGAIGFDRDALIGNSNIPEERIAKFATLDIDDDDGYLNHIIEKPDVVEPHSLVSMNAWLFSPMIFEACRSIEPSVRGEYEIASAVQYAIDHLGERFKVTVSEEGVLDLSSRADLESVRRFLER